MAPQPSPPGPSGLPAQVPAPARPGRSRLRRVGLGLAGLVLVVLAADRLFPPDLTRYHDRSTLVLDAQGRVLRAWMSGDEAWRLPITVGEVGPVYLDLLRAYEDRRFGRHPGVDPLALARAAGQAVTAGRIVSGGSTLTMQVARLLEPRPRTLPSKLVEMARALQLQARYGSAGVLDMYLTLAPMGGNLEGVRAASLAWFGREPDSLTPGQAALLVALPQSPTSRRPDRQDAGSADGGEAGGMEPARRARDAVLDRAVRAGVLTPAAAAEAKTEPMPDLRIALPFRAPHLAEGLRAAHPPGSVIRTSVDGPLQQAAEELAAGVRADLDPEVEVALIVAEAATGRIRAYVGGSFAGPTGQVDMVRAARSPGSALKPLIYGLGFDALPLHPETLVEDRPVSFGDWRPRNFDGGYQGTVTVRRALQLSLNIPAVLVLDRLGAERTAARLTEAGADLVLPAGAKGFSLPMALGGVGISLGDLAGLYTALAADGVARPLTALADGPTQKTPVGGEAAGATVGGTVGAGGRLLSPRAAWYVADILAGTPRPDGRSAAAGRWLAFKTGTSYGYRDAVAVGVTATHVIAVWVGRPDGTPRPGRMGRDAAAPLLFRLADLLPAAGAPPRPADALTPPSGRPLPPALRRFAPASPQGPAAGGLVLAGLTQGGRGQTGGGGVPLHIVFPPDGAMVELPRQAGVIEALPLEADGGTAPLRWLVNGLPLGGTGPGADWSPDGEGFATVTVMDAAGAQASARVRIRAIGDPPPP